MKPRPLRRTSQLTAAILAMLAHQASAGVMTWDGGGLDANWLNTKPTSKKDTVDLASSTAGILGAVDVSVQLAGTLLADSSKNPRLQAIGKGGSRGGGSAGAGGFANLGGGFSIPFESGTPGTLGDSFLTPATALGSSYTVGGGSDATLQFAGTSTPDSTSTPTSLLATSSEAAPSPSLGISSSNNDSLQASNLAFDASLVAPIASPSNSGTIGSDPPPVGSSFSSQSWVGGDFGLWATTSNWTNSIAPGAIYPTSTNSTDIATFDYTLPSAGLVSVGGSASIRNIGAIIFANTSLFGYDVTASTGGYIFLSNGGSIQTASVNGNHTDRVTAPIVAGDGSSVSFTANATSTTSILQLSNVAPDDLFSTLSITLNGTNNGSNEVVGVISGLASVTKSGVGQWLLGGVNTYRGQTLVSEGTLSITRSESLGTTNGNTQVNAGATVSLFSIGMTVAEPFTINGLGVGGEGAIRNYGDNFLTGALTLATASRINSETGLLTISGSSTSFTGASLTVGGATNTNISRVLDLGSNSLTKDGAGVLALSGANTYTGSTTITSGTLQLGGGDTTGSIHTTSAIINNATLAFNRSNSLAQGTDFNSVISGTGSVIQAGTGTTVLNGLNTYSGSTTIKAGILQINTIKDVNYSTGGTSVGMPTSVATGTISIGSEGTYAQLEYTGGAQNTDRVINLAGTTGGAGISQSGTGLLKFTENLTATGSGAKTLTLLGSSAGTGEMAGIIPNSSGGSTSLSKTGTGTWTLSAANTYSGVTTISGGVLSIGSIANGGLASNIGNSSNAAANLVFDGGTLQYTGTTSSTDRGFTIANSKTGIIEITNGSTTLTMSGSSASTTGGLTKTGLGKLNITGTNVYSGATQVTAGTLAVNNSTGSGTGTGAVTIDSGATLMGTGHMTGDVTVNGTHAPGNSPGIESTAGNLTYGATSVFEWELTANTTSQTGGPFYDQMLMTDNTKILTIVSGAKINLYFDLAGGTVDFSNTAFWNQTQSWPVITGYASFTGNFTINSISFDNYLHDSGDYPIGYPPGQFSMSGGTLTWTAVPEPTSALAGLLVTAGLLRRRRTQVAS